MRHFDRFAAFALALVFSLLLVQPARGAGKPTRKAKVSLDDKKIDPGDKRAFGKIAQAADVSEGLSKHMLEDGVLIPKDDRELKAFIKANPKKAKELMDPHTQVRRRVVNGKVIFYAIAYNKAFPRTQQIAGLMGEAKALAHDRHLKTQSGWVQTAYRDNKHDEYMTQWVKDDRGKYEMLFDMTYETGGNSGKRITEYDVGVRDRKLSALLQKIEQYVQTLHEKLPVPPKNRGDMVKPIGLSAIAMEGEVAGPYFGEEAAWDSAHYDNGTNEKDPTGSKNVLMMNIMQARVDKLFAPIAKQLLIPEQAKRVTLQGVLHATFSHEVTHGLGAKNARVGKQQKPVLEVLKDVGSPVEEAKAESGSVFNSGLLASLGAYRGLGKDIKEQIYTSWVARQFQTAYNPAETDLWPGSMAALNQLWDAKALIYDARKGGFEIDYARLESVAGKLFTQYLVFQADGQRDQAKAFFKTWAQPKKFPQIAKALAQLERAGQAQDLEVDFQIRHDPGRKAGRSTAK